MSACQCGTQAHFFQISLLIAMRVNMAAYADLSSGRFPLRPALTRINGGLCHEILGDR